MSKERYKIEDCFKFGVQLHFPNGNFNTQWFDKFKYIDENSDDCLFEHTHTVAIFKIKYKY